MSPDRCDIAVVEAGVSWSPTLFDTHECASFFSHLPFSFYMKFPQDPRNIPSFRARPRNIITCSFETRQLLARRSNKPRNHTKNDLTWFLTPPVPAFRKFLYDPFVPKMPYVKFLGHDHLNETSGHIEARKIKIDVELWNDWNSKFLLFKHYVNYYMHIILVFIFRNLIINTSKIIVISFLFGESGFFKSEIIRNKSN